MRLIFNHEGKPIEQPYQFTASIRFPTFKNGVLLLGKTHKTLEDWLESIRRHLLPLGISDFQYRPTPHTKDDDPLVLQFYFKKELDMLQFQAFAFGDSKGKFERKITSANFACSLQRQKNITNFAMENDITHTVFRVSLFDFKVITNSRFDDLAIASHYANGSFDAGVQALLPAPDVPRVLTRS